MKVKILVSGMAICSLLLMAETVWGSTLAGECRKKLDELKMYSDLMMEVEKKAPKGKKKGTILLKGAKLRQYCMLAKQMKSAAGSTRIWCESVSDKRYATRTEMAMIEILSTTCAGVW